MAQKKELRTADKLFRDKFLLTDIGRLQLKTAFYKALHAGGIEVYGDFLVRTQAEIKLLNGIGNSAFQAIQAALEKRGLRVGLALDHGLVRLNDADRKDVRRVFDLA